MLIAAKECILRLFAADHGTARIFHRDAGRDDARSPGRSIGENCTIWMEITDGKCHIAWSHL